MGGAAYLARNLKNCPILILACARSADLGLDPRRTAAILGREQEGALTRLPLFPLEQESTERLIESRLQRRPPATLVDWIFEQSRGNPLFVVALLQALDESGASLVIPALAGLPTGIIEQVMVQLADLPARTRSTLEVLAVAARSVPLSQLTLLRFQPSTSVADDVEDLLRIDLVTERFENREPAYEIVHPIVREAIYEAIPLARRQRIHQQLALSLVRQHRLPEASMHYVRGASLGDREAVNTLIAALRESEQRQSPYESMAMLEGLLSLLPSGDPRWTLVFDAMVRDADWILDYNASVSSEVGLRALGEIERSLEGSSDALPAP